MLYVEMDSTGNGRIDYSEFVEALRKIKRMESKSKSKAKEPRTPSYLRTSSRTSSKRETPAPEKEVHAGANPVQMFVQALLDDDAVAVSKLCEQIEVNMKVQSNAKRSPLHPEMLEAMNASFKLGDSVRICT